MQLPDGYRLDEVESPMFAGDVRKWYQATSPKGTKSLVYSNSWAAAKAAYLHEELGRWPREDEYVTGHQGKLSLADQKKAMTDETT